MTTNPGEQEFARGLGLQWTYEHIAALLKVREPTVRGYASTGRLPAPDGRLGGTPWWWEATIRDWAVTRPGQGARTDLAATPTQQ